MPKPKDSNGVEWFRVGPWTYSRSCTDPPTIQGDRLRILRLPISELDVWRDRLATVNDRPFGGVGAGCLFCVTINMYPLEGYMLVEFIEATPPIVYDERDWG